MQNQEKWKPSKFTYNKGKLTASKDVKEVSIGSRLNVALIADFYHRNLKQHAKGKLLDLGCGKVPLYAAYKTFISDNICVDWENTFHKNEYLDYELDLTKKLPFNDKEFDTIILSDVLEHIPVPELLWEEMTRILALNGKIIMNVPFYYWLHEQPHDYYRYTEFALRRFVDNCGLSLLQLEPVGGAPEIMTDIFAKNILRLPKFGRSLSLIAQWLALWFVSTKLGKKISAATSSNFPLGYFLVAEKTY